MSQFKEVLVGRASFANGAELEIVQVKRTGACRITDLNTHKASHSHSIANAWKSVMYQGRVRPDTHNTHGWPKNKGVYHNGGIVRQ
jgi:hypothetical protein